MSLTVAKAEVFKQDYANQFTWYVDEAGPATVSSMERRGKATNHPAHTVTWHDAVK